MWQQITVLAIVIMSAGYAAWSLLPPTMRWRLRVDLAAALQRAPAPLAAFARQVPRPGERPAAGGCTACPASTLHKAPVSRR